MVFLNKFIAVCSLLVTGSNAYLSTTSCRDTSPECLKESIQAALPEFVKGDPQLGTENLDPFVIKKLALTLPGDLKIEFINGTSKGLRKCVINSARMYGEVLALEMYCNLTIKGNYKSSGRLLMFTIDGNGDSIIKCKDIKIEFFVKLGSEIRADGKKYMEIKALKTRHNFEGQVYYRMTNLIKGNPQISDLIVEFMNRNWKLVAEEFGKPIVDFGVSAIVRNVKKLLDAVPLDDIVNGNNSK